MQFHQRDAGSQEIQRLDEIRTAGKGDGRESLATQDAHQILAHPAVVVHDIDWARSEEHTSELQSLMRISYAVFCLKKKKKYQISTQTSIIIHYYELVHHIKRHTQQTNTV